MTTAPTKGMLLVATPPLADPNFDRTVVLLLEHGAGGSLGLVLNRPSELPVAAALPGWEDLTADPPVVFTGGPVASEAAIAIGTRAGPPVRAGWEPVVGDVGTIDLHVDPEEAAAELGAVRIFAGYAGWSPGQLDGELAAGAWLVLPATPRDALDPDPDDLWRRVLLRQGGRTAWLANAPIDPSQN